MISKSVEYALRAVAHLAYLAPEPATTRDIAVATKVPEAYLSKILQGLVKGGIAKSQRGLHGGMTLTRGAEEITILDVVNAIEPVPRIKTCPLGLKSHGVRLCPLHKRIDDATAMVEKAFRDTTLAEVLAEPTESPPLCEVGTERIRSKPQP